MLSLLLGSFVFVFGLIHWAKIKRLPKARWLAACFVTLYASWAFSVIEDLFWKERLNFLQHLFSGISGILLAIWLGSASRTGATSMEKPER